MLSQFASSRPIFFFGPLAPRHPHQRTGAYHLVLAAGAFPPVLRRDGIALPSPKTKRPVQVPGDVAFFKSEHERQALASITLMAVRFASDGGAGLLR